MSDIFYRFCTTAADKGQRVEIITRNGYHMYGTIVVFDETAMQINHNGTHQLLMVDAISTIIPLDQQEGDWA